MSHFTLQLPHFPIKLVLKFTPTADWDKLWLCRPVSWTSRSCSEPIWGLVDAHSPATDAVMKFVPSLWLTWMKLDDIQLCSLVRVVLISELHIQTIHGHCHQVADRLDRYLDKKLRHSLAAMFRFVITWRTSCLLPHPLPSFQHNVKFLHVHDGVCTLVRPFRYGKPSKFPMHNYVLPTISPGNLAWSQYDLAKSWFNKTDQ